mgnify:CR=1 FL=1
MKQADAISDGQQGSTATQIPTEKASGLDGHAAMWGEVSTAPRELVSGDA